jgi:ubiquinone/menaquinone biosynthesis C-methylase UbiE
MPSLPLALSLALALAADPAQAPAPAGRGEPHPHHGGHREGGQHGNPADFAAYSAAMEDPSRDAWQKPDAIIRALDVKPGKVVCDIGAGPGYFALRLARAVGDSGRVFAVDVEPKMLEVLRERLGKNGLRNVTPVLSLGDDPLLPSGTCDLVLIVNTFHHFRDGTDYLRRLVRVLRPGGKVANIDFQKKATPQGPPLKDRVSREDFLKQAKDAGFALTSEKDFLPYQYFLVLAPSAH